MQGCAHDQSALTRIARRENIRADNQCPKRRPRAPLPTSSSSRCCCARDYFAITKMFSRRRLGCRWLCDRSNTGSSSTMTRQTRTGSALCSRSGRRRWLFVCNRMRTSSSIPASPRAPRPVHSVSPRRRCQCGSVTRRSVFSGSARSCAAPPFNRTKPAPPRS